jgi:hypothetical protein
MGFFSWECKGCNLSAVSTDGGGARSDAPYSLSEVVVLAKNGSVIIGEYDGYGRVNGASLEEFGYDTFGLWHKHCWEEAGKPAFDGPSERAGDQGFFFGPDRYGAFFNFEDEG